MNLFGEFFGPNGAGKSTFIKLLTGQLSPSIGFAKVLGTNVAKDPQKVKANVGIVPESESPPSYLTCAGISRLCVSDSRR